MDFGWLGFAKVIARWVVIICTAVVIGGAIFVWGISKVFGKHQ